MKINYRWLAGGVLLIAVFMMGRFSVGSHDGAGGDFVGAGEGARSASIGMGEGGEKMRHNRSVRAQKSIRSRRQYALKAIMAGLGVLEIYSADDPFADHIQGQSDKVRLLAWIMQASEDEFPDIMTLSKKTGGSVDESDNVVENVLLARWVEFDPDAALSWVKETESAKKDGDIDQRIVFLAGESLPYHTEWAIQKIKSAAQRMIAAHAGADPSEDPFDDPFGGNYLDLDLNRFYQRIAILYPAQRDTYKVELGDEAFEYGQSGWLGGLASSVGSDGFEALAEMTKDPETGKIDSWAFEVAARQDWKQAKRWVEQYGGDRDLDSTVWQHARVEDFDKAADWFLSRSLDQDDRDVRVYNIANQIDDHGERVEWLEKMEREGQPVARAWGDAVYSMISSRDFENALRYMPRASPQRKDELMKRIYEDASHGYRIYGDDVSVNYYTPREEDMPFLQAHPECREYILNANHEAVKKFSALLSGVERQLDVK